MLVSYVTVVVKCDTQQVLILMLCLLSKFAEVRHESWMNKISQLLHFLIVSLNSVMVSLTRWLNTFSRDYRYVSRVLAVEKKQLKVKLLYQ